MNTAANRYHWISSQAFELVPKTLRMRALPVLMSVAARMSHMASLPMSSLTASMSRDIWSRNDMGIPVWMGCSWQARQFSESGASDQRDWAMRRWMPWPGHGHEDQPAQK